MSKAEDRANKRYSIARGDDTQETSGIDMQKPDFDNTNGTNTIKFDKEEELTEFEKAVECLMGKVQCGKLTNLTVTTKEQSKKLLSIARKQIANEINIVNIQRAYKDAFHPTTDGLLVYTQGIEDTLNKIKGI